MARLLRDTVLQSAPIAVPVPGSWDPIAQAAYEQGRADGLLAGHAAGYESGYETGYTTARVELETLRDELVSAAAVCHGEIVRAHRDLVTRVIELAELYVQTVVRHVPDASAQSLLARIDEALAALEPGQLEVSVPAAVLDEVRAIFAAREQMTYVTVIAGTGLAAGEYRIRGDWADADGAWHHYVAAATEAISAYLAEQAE